MALLVFTAVGLIASTWALYVHYRLQSDPTYVSVCEVNESVSCQQVLTSQYGSVAGVPVAAGGTIWALLVFMLAAFGLKEPKSETASRVAGYIFVLATLGLATVFYFGYVSFFVLKTACLLCMSMYVSVIGTFLLSAGAAGPIAALPSRLGRDFAALIRNPRAATLAVVWLAVSAGLILLQRRSGGDDSGKRFISEASSVPAETLTTEQRTEWEAWLSTAARPGSSRLSHEGSLLKFNDYHAPRAVSRGSSTRTSSNARRRIRCLRVSDRDYPPKPNVAPRQRGSRRGVWGRGRRPNGSRENRERRIRGGAL
jgi:uncharacterized membrane protein